MLTALGYRVAPTGIKDNNAYSYHRAGIPTAWPVGSLMAANDPWWLVSYKPIGSTSAWTFKTFQGTEAYATAQEKLAVNGTLDGPFSSKADAVAAETKEKKTPIPQIGLPGVKNPLGTLSGFLAALENKNTWLRVGEVALGLILIGVGIAKITGTANVISKAAKVAIAA